MSIFVMIPGAWHGGWCFEALREPLAARGHHMIAGDLPGMGGADASLAGWADYTAELCRAQSGPVILCGHSRGGIVISEAGERAPGSISALVYICAFLLPSGQSFVEMASRFPRDPVFEAGIAPAAGGGALDISADAAKAAFYNRVPEDVRSAACARLVAEPLAPSLTPLQLSAEHYGRLPRHYIECLDDRAIPVEAQRTMQKEAGALTSWALDSDHSPFMSYPQELAETLGKIAHVQ